MSNNYVDIDESKMLVAKSGCTISHNSINEQKMAKQMATFKA